MKCWLCGVEITKENSAGKKGDGLSNTCRTCNTVYVLVRTLKQLPMEELESKISSTHYRLTVHRVVRDNKDLSPAELTRLVLTGRS